MTAKPRANFNVQLNTIKGRYLLVQHNQAYEITDVGVLIWGLCDGNHTIDQIAEAIAAEYEVDLAQASQDTAEFLNEIETLGLIR